MSGSGGDCRSGIVCDIHTILAITDCDGCGVNMTALIDGGSVWNDG